MSDRKKTTKQNNDHNIAERPDKTYFPTSEEFYKRVLSDPKIQACHVSIVYFDSVLQKMIPKMATAWKEISKGGDIPWHRVHYFKYKDTVVWNRAEKTCTINELLESSTRSNLNESFSLMTYNILSDDLEDRIDSVLTYIGDSGTDIVCLQEVSNKMVDYIRVWASAHGYNLSSTDLKANNVVFLAKPNIVKSELVVLNFHKQAIIVTILNHLELEVDFVGLHLTSDYKSRADDKRREQLNIILAKLGEGRTVFVTGDFNTNDEVIPQLDNFNDSADHCSKNKDDVDSEADVKIVFTYDPETNPLAKKISQSGARRRFDRIYVNKHYSSQTYLVETDNKLSDHYPVIAKFKYCGESTQEIRNIGENRKTSCMIMIHDQEIDRLRKKYDIGYDRWPAHLNIFYGFIDRDEFDDAYLKLKPVVDKYLGHKLVFDQIKMLDQSKYSMACLCPDATSEKIILSLRREIGSALGIRIEHYTPHISLGRMTDADSTLKSLQSLKHECTLAKVFMSEYGSDTYIEPRRCFVRKDDWARTKLGLVEILESILNVRVYVGGSSLYDEDASDLDVVVRTDGDKQTQLKSIRKKLVFSGEAYSVECVENAYTSYLKIRTFLGEDIDLHLDDNPPESDLVLTTKIILEKMMTIGRRDLFVESVKKIKQKFRELNIYGQVHGYLNGVNVAIMIGHLLINDKDGYVNSENVVEKFCQMYSEWKHPDAISILGPYAYEHDNSKVSSMIRIASPIKPYQNTVRTITKSTFDVVINALKLNLQSVEPYRFRLVIGIKCYDENMFYSAVRFVDSHVVRLIIAYEALDVKVMPLSRWQTLFKQENGGFTATGYLQMYLTNNTLPTTLDKMITSFNSLYPNQIIRCEVKKVK
ncbi:hypothetical protein YASMINEVIRUS_97 [Yasminevirus sp. GU-2018]|uniref:Uncharacterized protein n=1 Tax=Yasminevirus sp. GU-2018 TaxID=2420051 RepID=A0A5K0U810_9VIRU|nr:hypothetical protein YASMINEVIRUS_97 [Yasminevirus sp. GU-2018]